VRWSRQVIDLLDQLRDVMGKAHPVGKAADEAVRSMRRGVVALGTA
jgi:ATP-dependent RNA helicase HelY